MNLSVLATPVHHCADRRVAAYLGAGRNMAPPLQAGLPVAAGPLISGRNVCAGSARAPGEGIEGTLRVRLGRLRVVRAQRHPAHRPAAPPSPRGAAWVGGGKSASYTWRLGCAAGEAAGRGWMPALCVSPALRTRPERSGPLFPLMSWGPLPPASPRTARIRGHL